MSMLEGKLGMIAGVAAAAAGVVGIGAAALWLTEEEDEETEQDTVNDGSKSPRKDAAAAAAPRDSKIFAIIDPFEREQALRQIFDAQLAVKKEIAGEYKKYLTEENCKTFDAKMAAIETDGPTPEATWLMVLTTGL